MRTPVESPSIGVLLCESRSGPIVEFALENTNQPIGVSTYQVTRQNIVQPIGVSTYRVTRELPEPLQAEVPSIEDLQGVVEKLGVVSQHRFDDSILFLKQALLDGRLGKILQADAYVKWYRSAEYYSRPIKGSWAGEGGGALINQAIHQIDLLMFLIGAVDEVFAYWQLGSLHNIESEDTLCALLHYACGATGVLQASTSLWPGSPERLEIHGTKARPSLRVTN